MPPETSEESNGQWKIDGRLVGVSSPGKIYWPEDNLTKEDMLRYYVAVAPVLLPHLKDRPVTLRVFPQGIHGFSYYRRDLPEHAPDWLRSVYYRPATSDEVIHVPLVDDAAGLVWLANLGSIEFHMWASRTVDLTQPDQAIFDLDPGDDAGFTDALQAALRVGEALDRLGLRSYPKTSGGQGIHLHVPLAPGYAFEAVREWVKSFAEDMAAAHPQLIAVASGPTHRGDRVTVDYAQNSVGRNTAAPYTLRARAKAPVATPLTWEEIEQGQRPSNSAKGKGSRRGGLQPQDFTLETVPARIRQVGDLFAPVLQGGQHLPERAPGT